MINETITSGRERIWILKKVHYSVAFYKALGYDVTLLDQGYKLDEPDETRSDAIFTAITDPDVGAVSYFAHADEPSIEDQGADNVATHLARARKAWYMRQGMSEKDARLKANSEVSIALDIYYNHTCHSADEGFEEFADQIIREGGVYYGEPGLLWATSAPDTEYIKGFGDVE